MNGNAKMRDASGHVKDSRPLVAFLYGLARDRVPTGELESLIDRVITPEHALQTVAFTNGWLARWAQYTADRLTAAPNPPVEPDPDLKQPLERER